MDYSARWYSPVNGRFTTQDTWTGDSFAPQTLNRYAYALNNPINITDPTGHIPCDIGDDGECSPSPHDRWNTPSDPGGGGGYTPPPWDNWGPLPGDGSTDEPRVPTEEEIRQLKLQRKMQKALDFELAAGHYQPEQSSYTRYDLVVTWMVKGGNYNPYVSLQENIEEANRDLHIKGAVTRQDLSGEIQRLEANQALEGYCRTGADNGRDPECSRWRLTNASGPSPELGWGGSRHGFTSFRNYRNREERRSQFFQVPNEQY